MHWWTLQQLKFKNPQTRRQAVEKLAAAPQEADAVPSRRAFFRRVAGQNT